MNDYTDIKRNHFRFPAFSDEDGVKLQDSTFRKPFSFEEDWILTDEDIDRKANRQNKVNTSRRGNKTIAHKAGHSVKQMEELKKHRENLPTYSRHPKVEVTPTGKKNLFGCMRLIRCAMKRKLLPFMRNRLRQMRLKNQFSNQLMSQLH